MLSCQVDFVCYHRSRTSDLHSWERKKNVNYFVPYNMSQLIINKKKLFLGNQNIFHTVAVRIGMRYSISVINVLFFLEIIDI